MIISERFIKETSAEYGISADLFGRAFCRAPSPLPYIVLVIARNRTKAESVAEFLPKDELENYLLEDELEELEVLELRRNEVIICDKMFESANIQPGDILVYDPERVDYTKEMFVVVEIEGFKFAAILDDNANNQFKYWLSTEAYCEDFTVYKAKVKILGAVVGWRKAGEAEYREFNII